MVDLCFNGPEQLQVARLMVMKATVTYSEGQYVWLDAKKTRKEMKLSRMLHRAADFCTACEAKEGRGRPVEKDVRKRKGKVACAEVGQVMGSSWCRLPQATAAYDAEELGRGKSFIEEE